MPSNAQNCDAEVEQIFAWLSTDRRLEKTGMAIRSAIDFVIDGGRTSRYSIEQLQPSEKVYIGNRVEHSILYELDLPKQAPFDTCIEGLPVDIKFSISESWMIPPEAVGEVVICIIVTAQDEQSKFSLGVLRAEERFLAKGGNRDGKKSITKDGKSRIRWVGKDAPLPPNFLLLLPAQIRDAVFAKNKGQPAVTELFRVATNRIVPRVAVETVAKQLDPTKRIRDARLALRVEGIRILSGRYDGPELTRLGFKNVPRDCFVSVKP